jgi:hypothetical protein
MTDYVQFWVTDMAEITRLWKHPLLYYKNTIKKVSKSSGEIYKKRTKEFEGITFRREAHYPTKPNEAKERIVIGFKPHYWHNEEKHNANDFNALKSIETVKKFIDVFNIQVYEHYPTNNLEYGLNFLLKGYGKEIIGYNIYHSRNIFTQDREYRYAKRAHSYNRKGKPNDYLYAKLYSKGFQHPEYCNPDTLRFEIGSKESKNIKRFGIKNIGDLLNIDAYYELKKSLIDNASNVLIIDQHPNLKTLSTRHKNRLIKYSNSSFWYDTLQQKRHAAFNEKKESYFELLNQTGYNINIEFQNSIRAKLELLLPEKRKDSTASKELEKRKDSTLDKGGILTVSNSKICPITGVNISMQKKDSILLSHTGLRYYYKTDKRVFKEVENKFLSKLWQNANYELQIKEMAHNIRNTANNQRTKYANLYSDNQGRIFDW